MSCHCPFLGLGIHSFAHLLIVVSLKIARFKEQPWAIAKSNVSDLLVIQANRLQKTSDLLEKIFFICFDSFSPFYAQEQIAPVALRSFALF